MDKEVMKELLAARSVISTLLDKAWEIGGYALGEEEFEKCYWVKDAREQINLIDSLLK